jgi:hypothetical protein
MVGLYNIASKFYNKKESQPMDGGDMESGIDPKIVVTEWNKFGNWLGAKKMRGSLELDKNNLGLDLFNKWRQETNSPLTLEDMSTVRSIYKKSIDDDYEKIKSGRLWMPRADGSLAKNQDEVKELYDKFKVKHYEANEASANPNYPGSNFTRMMLPESYDVNVIKDDFKNIKSTKDIDKLKISSESDKNINYNK